MIRLTSAALAATFAMLAVPAQAQTVSAANPESIVAALQDKGYQAKLGKDDGGDPMIESATDGTKFFIFFFGCTNNRACATLQFYAGFKNNGKSNITTMNDWNKAKRFGRAYIDKDNDPVIDMDLDLDDGGMSRALFDDNVEFWAALIPTFKAHISK